MFGTRPVWVTALWIGVLIHLDWHLGRPGHTHLSLGLPYHWLLGVVTFTPLPWLLARRWPGELTVVSLLVVALGVLLGQGIEPLGESIVFGVGVEPFTNAVRWRVFAEFMTAGVVALGGSAVVAAWRARRTAPP